MNKDWILRSMRKRRVGVTARSRQIVGNQATGSLQIDTEMAAPLALRTPTGTAAEAANRVRMEAWRQWRWSQLAESNSSEEMGTASACAESGAPKGAHEALPQTPPGDKSPETPAPFPSAPIFQNGGNQSRVRKPRNNGAPLTDCLRSEEFPNKRERGLLVRGQQHHAASRWSAPRSSTLAQT